MSELAKRVAAIAAVLSVVTIGIFAGIGPAAADCDMSSPEAMENCEDPSINPLTGVFDNMLDIAKAFLQYAGFVAVFAGVTLWFATDNEQRSQLGMGLTVGGLAMIMLFFANSAIIQLIKGIAQGF